MYNSKPNLHTIIIAFLMTVVLSGCETNTAALNSGSSTPSSGVEIPVSDSGSSTPSSETEIPTTGTGTASLSWTAPVDNSDGSPLELSDIGGYRIYYGTSSDNLSLVEDISDSSITEETFTSLPQGTHYFSVTVYNTAGVESEFSNIVSKTIG